MAFKPSIYRVGRIGCGIMAVMARPVPGEWVAEEFAGIAMFGIRRVVSLLEVEEAEELGLGDEGLLCKQNGMEFLQYPIADRGLPGSVSDFARLTRMLHVTIGSGLNSVIHCRVGIGRTGIVAAGVLLNEGFGPVEAFEIIGRARGLAVPDTEEQREWLIAHHREIIAGE